MLKVHPWKVEWPLTDTEAVGWGAGDGRKILLAQIQLHFTSTKTKVKRQNEPTGECQVSGIHRLSDRRAEELPNFLQIRSRNGGKWSVALSSPCFFKTRRCASSTSLASSKAELSLKRLKSVLEKGGSRIYLWMPARRPRTDVLW